MKTLLSLLSLSLTFALFGQTELISTKSHSCVISDHSRLDADNFGLMEPSYYVREIEYLGSCCIVQKTEWEYSKEYSLDTICDDELMQRLNYDPKLIKEYFPENVRLVGFEKYKKERHHQDQNGFDPNIIWFYIALVAGFVTYLFFPVFSLTKK